jgi:outer membrane protein OmpA-like peptidoglycan-associated protein
MKTSRFLLAIMMAVVLLMSDCARMNKTQKGAVIGTAGGAATGAVIGRASGNTALGTIIGAVVGGAAGAIIGRQMDKQAEELKKEVPDANVIRFEEGIILELSDKVLFDVDKSALTPASKQSLEKLAEILVKYPDTKIEIQGHTDNTGTSEHNQTLSEQRARSVFNNLADKNISTLRMITKGYGETAPKVANDTEGNRSLNRRVDFLIYANDKLKAAAKKEASN